MSMDRLPSGSWRVRWTGLDGLRRAAVFKTVEVAREALRARIIEVDRARAGLEPTPSPETLAALAPGWLARRGPDPAMDAGRRVRRARRVADNRADLERHILPAIGRLRPRDVTPEVLAGFVRRLESTRSSRAGHGGKTLAASTVRNVVTTLRKMLRDLGRPVEITIRLPRTAPVWIRERADVGRFLAACRPPWFRVAAALAVYPGLRRGEVAALRWKRVDFRRRVISVEESWETDPKDHEWRVVPLAPELAAILRAWRRGKPGGPDDRVVRFSRGAHVARYSREACLRAGVEAVTYHELRHTAASHLAERLPLPVVQRILGHGSVVTTGRYAHASDWAASRDPRASLSYGARSGHGRKRSRRRKGCRRRGRRGATRI